MTTTNTVETTNTQAVKALNIFDGLNGRKMSDTGRAAYTHGSGAGNDAFGYRRGSGASAVAFVFSVNHAYNANSPLTKGQTAVQQLNAVEGGYWPGRTRGAVEQQIASLLGGQYLMCVSGAYKLTPKGEASAALMLAEIGLSPVASAEDIAKAKADAEFIAAENAKEELAKAEANAKKLQDAAEAEAKRIEDEKNAAALKAKAEAAKHDKSANTAKNRKRSGK